MLLYGRCECFVMHMLYVCVLCVSCGNSQCCVLHDLQFVNAGRGCNRRPYGPAPNGTAYKRWRYHKLLCKLCPTLPPPVMGGPDLPFVWASRPCGPPGWLALLLTKAGDVETNPGLTTSHKRVWICDICYKQIHIRKQISIRCNWIEHWVHLRCAGIRQTQYTDTWTCHLHKRIARHTDINATLPLRTLVQALYPLPTYTTHTTATKTQTHVQHSPCSHRIGKVQSKSSHSLTPPPLSTQATPSQTHKHLTYSTNSSTPTYQTHP